MTYPDLPDASVDPQGQESQDLGTGEQAGGATSGNPWDDHLSKLPESVRPLVEPTFREWDANVNQRFQRVHSEYEPYKELISTYEPDALSQAVAMAQALEEDPQRFLAALQEAFGTEQGAEGQPQEEDDDSDDPFNPYAQQLQQHEQLLELMAQQMLAEREAQEHAQEDALLDEVLGELHQEHGEFDENYVLSLIANGAEPDEAVAQFKAVVEGYAQKLNAPQSQAPMVVGSAGAGMPVHQQDVSSLSSKDTKNLVAQMLAQAAAQRQG